MKILSFSDFINEENQDGTALKGGLADFLSPDDIAKKHKVKVDVIEAQIKKGIKEEMKEHTDDEVLAREMSMNHIMSDLNYYSGDEKVEEDAGAPAAGGGFASLGSTPGMGAPTLASRGVTGSGDVSNSGDGVSYNTDGSKSRRNKRKRSKRGVSKEDEKLHFRRMERLRKFGDHN